MPSIAVCSVRVVGGEVTTLVRDAGALCARRPPWRWQRTLASLPASPGLASEPQRRTARRAVLVDIQPYESRTLLHRATPFACSSAWCSNRRVTYDATIGVGRFILTTRSVDRVGCGTGIECSTNTPSSSMWVGVYSGTEQGLRGWALCGLPRSAALSRRATAHFYYSPCARVPERGQQLGRRGAWSCGNRALATALRRRGAAMPILPAARGRRYRRRRTARAPCHS